MIYYHLLLELDRVVGKKILFGVWQYCIFQSETFSIYDCIKYDKGTQNEHTDSIWNNVDLFDRQSEYTIFTDTANQIRFVEITGDVAIEVDINTNISASDGIISIRKGTSQLTDVNLNKLNLEQNTWNTIRCEIKNNMCTFSANGVSTTPVNVTDFNRYYLRVVGNKQLLFKNLAVYSI